MISAIQTRYNWLFDATVGKLWVTRTWDAVDRAPSTTRQALSRSDTLMALGFGLVGIAVSIWAFMQTGRAPDIHQMSSLWLQADVPRLAENMVSTAGNNSRTAVHPVLSILLYPFGKLLTVAGMDPLMAAKTLIVLIMGANAALFSLTVRLLGLPRLVVAAFTLLFIATASFMFWSGIVESFQFSGFALILSLFMMLRINTAHWGWWVLVSLLSLGFLITNWVFGLIAMAVRLKLKPFVSVVIISLTAAVALSIAQNAAFSKASFFFNPKPLMHETHFLQTSMAADGTYEEGWQPVSNLRSIYVTSVVAMPAYPQQQGYGRLTTTNQNSGLPKDEISPLIAIAAWVLLFGLGLWGTILRRDIRLPLIGAGLMLLVQTGLHLIYGEVTFLYSLNFMPLLILFASCAWFVPWKQAAVALASLVIVFGGINNERRLQQTINLTDCLADNEVVRTHQNWDIIKTETVGEARDAHLDIKIDERCKALYVAPATSRGADT
ncbi:hypothetical protein WNY37_14360 [Henriciella sp. AS95]|uniref:hypothetical protein n=1 Tax=Henriciella sp. AS95 TaxID=3135782 RepID=UPI00316C70DA